MTTTFETHAVIINTLPYGEADVIFHALSAELGNVTFIARKAKSSKHRFASSLEVFDRGRFTCHRRKQGLAVVSAFVPVNPFRTLRSDYAKMTVASVLCECFDHLTQEHGEGAADLHEILVSHLCRIDEAPGLREACRAACEGIGHLLAYEGYWSQDPARAPSAKLLREMLQIVEHNSERGLKSRSCLEETLKLLE